LVYAALFFVHDKGWVTTKAGKELLTIIAVTACLFSFLISDFNAEWGFLEAGSRRFTGEALVLGSARSSTSSRKTSRGMLG
jgi:hypothetical protein